MVVANLLSEKEICEKYGVTPEEIDKATRILNTTTGEVWYQVESRSGNEPHEVHYNKEFRRLTCNCKAGRVGVPCWAKRAAMAAAFIYRQEQRIANAKEQEQQEKELLASQQRAYESDKAWQKEERAASRGKVALGPQERRFEEFDGRMIPMR